MPLVLEDGTGISGADAYVSTAEVDTYAAAYGKGTVWASLQSSAKEIHVRKATRFADDKYPFPGTPLKGTQGLFFPVDSITVRGWPVTGVPRQLKDAVCELAIISANGTDLIESVSARAYTYRSVKAGDVEKTERFDSVDNQPIFRGVELLLTPLLSGNVGAGYKIVRLKRA
jgi:hypothetical protein